MSKDSTVKWVRATVPLKIHERISEFATAWGCRKPEAVALILSWLLWETPVNQIVLLMQANVSVADLVTALEKDGE